jgi:hypothetical protein
MSLPFFMPTRLGTLTSSSAAAAGCTAKRTAAKMTDTSAFMISSDLERGPAPISWRRRRFISRGDPPAADQFSRGILKYEVQKRNHLALCLLNRK